MSSPRNLAATPGRHHNYVPGRQLSHGDAWVLCPLGGTWRTIRPAGPAVESCAEAHRLAHVKGWAVDCELPEPTPMPQAVKDAARRAAIHAVR